MCRFILMILSILEYGCTKTCVSLPFNPLIKTVHPSTFLHLNLKRLSETVVFNCYRFYWNLWSSRYNRLSHRKQPLKDKHLAFVCFRAILWSKCCVCRATSGFHERSTTSNSLGTVLVYILIYIPV